MVLKDKIIAFIGDSITEGYGIKEYKNIYHQVIKELYGCKECLNYGISGTRLAMQTSPTLSYPKFDITFGMRVPIIADDVDIICVFGGGNDYAHGDAYFGDENSTNPYTLNGALNLLFKDLKEKFKNKPIIMLTPLPCGMEDFKAYPEGYIYKDYISCIIEGCRRNDIPCIDLYNNPLFPGWDRNYLPDGAHPNDYASRLLGEYIGKRLLEL